LVGPLCRCREIRQQRHPFERMARRRASHRRSSGGPCGPARQRTGGVVGICRATPGSIPRHLPVVLQFDLHVDARSVAFLPARRAFLHWHSVCGVTLYQSGHNRVLGAISDRASNEVAAIERGTASIGCKLREHRFLKTEANLRLAQAMSSASVRSGGTCLMFNRSSTVSSSRSGELAPETLPSPGSFFFHSRPSALSISNPRFASSRHVSGDAASGPY